MTDIGRCQWDAWMCVRDLRDTIRQDPDARAEVDDKMLNDTVDELVGLLRDLSAGRKTQARERAREVA
jgi:hypothetical protein